MHLGLAALEDRLKGRRRMHTRYEDMGHAPMVGRQGLLRDLNYRAVLEYLALVGPTSRSDLAAALRLSRPSVTRLVDGLMSVGLVKKGAHVSSRVGRRRVLIEIDAEAAVVVGASVRPRRLRLTLSDLAGKSLWQGIQPTDGSTAVALAEQLASLTHTARSEVGLDGRRLAAVAVGITGAWDDHDARLHAAPNLPRLEGVDLRSVVQTAYARRFAEAFVGGTTRVENDVNFAALGELAAGVAAGRSSFFYLSLGSGVGGATVVDGRVHAGEHGFAGEVGYLPVFDGERSRALEELVSRGALASEARALALGDDAHHLLEAAAHGHAGATRIVERTGRYLGMAVAAIMTTLNPQCIVLGGSVGRYADVLVPAIERALPPELPIRCEIVGTALRGDASLVGAVRRAQELARESLIQEDLT